MKESAARAPVNGMLQFIYRLCIEKTPPSRKSIDFEGGVRIVTENDIYS